MNPIEIRDSSDRLLILLLEAGGEVTPEIEEITTLVKQHSDMFSPKS